MRIMKRALIFCVALFMFAIVHMKADASNDVELIVTKADEWTSLFQRSNLSENAWAAADGIYSVALNGVDSFGSADIDTDTFFMFNDTCIGPIDEKGFFQSVMMPHNTAAVLDSNSPNQENIEFFWGENGSNTNDKQKRNLLGGKYWNGDILVLDDTLYIFAFSIKDLLVLDKVYLFSFPIIDGKVDFTSLPNLHYGRKDIGNYNHRKKQWQPHAPDNLIKLFSESPECSM